MQANEFAKHRKAPATPSAAPPKLVEKKLRFKRLPGAVQKEAASPDSEPSGPSDLIGPGAQVKPGTELHRIRTHNPTLWTKIQNWD